MITTEILKIIGTTVLNEIVSTTLKKLKPESFTIKKSEFDKVINDFPERYQNHFNDICKWASSIPFIGLTKPKKTYDSTIELIIASDIVQERNNDKNKISEFDVLNSTDNILLIGAPGAGKTTTLKRLILKYITEFSNFENTGFPILIRLRDISSETTLLKYILDIFSIKYEDKIVKYEKKIKKTDKNTGEIKEEIKILERLETFVGESQIQSFVIKFLNTTNCLLMLDGFDELHKSNQLSTLRDIEDIGLKLTNSKILVTVRKSELNKIINNFTTFEIDSLSPNQIDKIASKWLCNKDLFIQVLKSKPYYDLANRPIFLTFLLILFDKYAALPVQPSEIYEDTIYLIIKEWDEHRDINRQSKYSDFNTRKKLKFLSELSYYMTYKIKQKVFSTKDLENIYITINDKYGLPEYDMKDVVLEIESHTGLIAESNFRNFEFSHLSLQEFLCAKHLVNLPYSKETITYFFEYPEPIAIAISISGEPSIWFSNLILNNSLNITNFKRNENIYYSSLYTLLNRLLIETPSFKISQELGLAFFYLISNLHKNDNFKPILNEWFNYNSVKESISLAIKGTVYSYTYAGIYLIYKKTPTPSEYFITIPNTGEIPDTYIKALIDENLISLKEGMIV